MEPIESLALLVSLGLPVLGWYRPRPALVALPVVAGAWVLAGFLDSSPATVISGLLPLVLTPLAVWLRHVDRPLGQRHEGLFFGLGAAMGLLVMGAGVLLALWDMTALALGLVAVGIALPTVVGSRAWRRAWRRTGQEVLGVIEVSMRLRLPLVPALEMAAAAYGRGTQRVLRRIAHWLLVGCPLSEALARAYPQCPRRVVAAVVAAEPLHQVPETLRGIREDLRERRQGYGAAQPGGGLYPLVMLTVCYLVLLGLLVWVLPEVHEIFQGLRPTALPVTTRLLIRATRRLGGEGWALLPVLLLPACFLAAPLCLLWNRGQGARCRVWLRALTAGGDWIRWHLPVLGGLESLRSRRQATAYLGQALQSGAPVNEALAHAADLDVNHVYRRRLRRWRQAVESGRGLAAAAAAARVGRGLVWAFEAGVHGGATPTLLLALSDCYRSVAGHRRRVLRALFVPLSVVALGVVVGGVAHVVFGPLVAVIHVFADFIP